MTRPNPPEGIDDHESLIMAIHQRSMPYLTKTDGSYYKQLPTFLLRMLAKITGGCSRDWNTNAIEKRITWWQSHYGNLRYSLGLGGREGASATQQRMRITSEYWESNENDLVKHAMECLCKNANDEDLSSIITMLQEEPSDWIPYIRSFGQECISSQDEDTSDTSKITQTNDGRFKIWAGIPGTGKSYQLNESAENIVSDSKTDKFQTVFHPEYSFYDFVGQIQPRENDAGGISYPFVPGPFAMALKRANELAYLAESNGVLKNVVLVVEELNRGNASAIFGEIFQLLDLEDNGKSKYGFHNYNLAKYLGLSENQDIRLPSNLFIFASMNISDQNVYPLDTAFLRRWDRQYTSADNWDGDCSNWLIQLPNGKIKWKDFAKTVNDWLIVNSERLGIQNPEDKRLGPWFVEERHCLDQDLFSNKVMVYLWTNVFTHITSRTGAFSGDCNSLESLLSLYSKTGLNTFEPNLATELNNFRIESDGSEN